MLNDEIKVLKIYKPKFSLTKLKKFKPNNLYDKKIPLSSNEIRDIKKMVTKNYIPDKFHDYYNNLISIE